MSLKKYVIRGLGEFFDGLVVHCDDEKGISTDSIQIERIEQPSKLFETFSLPVNNGLWIHVDNLELYREPTDEQLTENPFGMYKSEGKIEKDDVCITWGLYSRALTLSIKNKDKTLLSKNVFDKEAIHNVRAYLEQNSMDKHWDIYVALFDIQEICDGEKS